MKNHIAKAKSQDAIRHTRQRKPIKIRTTRLQPIQTGVIATTA